MEELTAAQHLAIARHSGRPNVADYVGAIFTDFFEQRGDRLCGEDPAILGGVAMFHGHPVTVIGTRMVRRFRAMASPCPRASASRPG